MVYQNTSMGMNTSNLNWQLFYYDIERENTYNITSLNWKALHSHNPLFILF